MSTACNHNRIHTELVRGGRIVEPTPSGNQVAYYSKLRQVVSICADCGSIIKKVEVKGILKV